MEIFTPWKFVLAWLEEKVPNIVKEDVDRVFCI